MGGGEAQVVTVGPGLHADLRALAGIGPVVPVLLHGVLPAWFVSRPDDIADAAKDPRLTSDSSHMDGGGSSVKFGFFGMDGREHTRLRGLVAPAFAARRMARLRPEVQRVADELVDAIVPTGRCDLIADVALPLPMTVICALLGVPLSDRDDFARLAAALFRPGTPERLAADRERLRGHLRGLVGRARTGSGGGFIGELAVTGGMTDAELVDSATLLLFAGYETTAALIGTSMLALIREPGQLRLVRERPELIGHAVTELVRLCGPFAAGMTRYTTEPVVIAGVEIPARRRVLLGLGAADRDPCRHADPDRLDITRADQASPFAFGRGPHFCVGAPLARLELEIAVGTLARRLDGLRPDGEPVWRDAVLYGLERLPVAYTPRQVAAGGSDAGSPSGQAPG